MAPNPANLGWQMNFEAGKEKISKPSKQSGWWWETFGFLRMSLVKSSFLALEVTFFPKVWRRVSTTCAPKQLQMPSNSLWMWMPWRDLGRRDPWEQWAVDPGYLLFFFGRDEILPRYTIIQWIIFFSQYQSGSSDEPISGISQAFWLLLTWALRWTGNPPWIILVWSKIAAWETQPFLNRKSACRHGYFQRYLRICGNLSEYLCVTCIQDLIYIYIYVHIYMYIYIYIYIIYTCYILHMIHILWLCIIIFTTFISMSQAPGVVVVRIRTAPRPRLAAVAVPVVSPVPWRRRWFNP